MRTHRKYSQFLLWDDAAGVREVAQLRHLVSARIEPVVRGLRGGALMDLTFIAEERVIVIPCIEVVPEMLQEREMSALVWPHEAAHQIGEGAVEEIERALLPWIESLTLARQLNSETVRAFGSRDANATVAAARGARFLGAAPYTDVIHDGAPYLYAVRFAQNARIAVRDRCGAYGAALLGRHAREVCADFGDAERDALVRRWYAARISDLRAAERPFDLALYGAGEEAVEADVHLLLDAQEEDPVRIATPVPSDVMFSFDPQDAPACRAFALQRSSVRPARTVHVRPAPAAGGGSSGRILMLLREDYLRAPDADSDEAQSLAALLRAEGFSVDVRTPSQARPAEYDLVHAFTLARVNELLPVLTAAQSARIPVVLSPFFQDLRTGGTWGTAIVRAVLASSNDEIDLEDSLDLVAQRRLEAPGLSAKSQEPFAGYEGAVRAALAIAGAMLTGNAAEAQELQALGFSGNAFTVWPCVTDTEPAPCPVGGDFILAHVPVEARSNVLPLVRAATASRLPLVVAGEIVEPEYALAVKHQAGENVFFLAEPDAATAAALYRAARVYADVSWVRFGVHRLMRAAASGAALLTAPDANLRAVLGPDAVWETDPTSQRGIALALSDAWMHAGKQPKALDAAARQAGALADPRAALLAAVQAYAAAQQVRAPA